MIRVSILQTNYIPWLGYFYLISRSNIFVTYDIVQYTKNDWRNRNIIRTTNGPQWLTVPIHKTKLSDNINTVTISNSYWMRKHWMSIEQNYSKSPFFEETYSNFKKIYNKNWEFLSDLNNALIREVMKCLEIKTKVVNAESLAPIGGKNERILDICNKLNATTYITGPAAKSYLNKETFEDNDINIEWIDYSTILRKFEGRYSVLDTIFNNLNDAKLIINHLEPSK
ncbi:WbqC family protein [Agarivorans gilvus]|uniref:WbqC family protein n=1 Tax=Agarivorans gilvus TaxID=680279 RepID=A0ABQ1I350_9ALTE|nr:WbqC family protein [Agarivorans gilvus]GGB10536.1 hypothetical protein GCM10007414_24880 [Agarivorans gilvus]